MATYTYDPSLPTDKDWVRFLVGDRGTVVSGSTISGAYLADEEIDALLIEEANKYLAAARAGDVILVRSQGVLSKVVDDLALTFGRSATDAYAKHLQTLREKGCKILLRSSGGASIRIL